MKRTLTLGGGAARVLAALLERWPLLLVAAFLISPIGPHLRVSYVYRGTYSHPIYLSCTYLGSRGFVTVDFRFMDDCPVVAWFDSREAAR